MQSLKKTVLLGSMLLSLGVASSMAGAAGFSPPGPFSSTSGNVVLKWPATFQAPMTCNLSVSGSIDVNGVATITTASLSGNNALCTLPKVQGLPWSVNLSSASQGTLTSIGFSMPNLARPGESVCGPGSLAVTWDNAAHVLAAANQAMNSNCTLVSLNVTLAGSLTTHP